MAKLRKIAIARDEMITAANADRRPDGKCRSCRRRKVHDDLMAGIRLLKRFNRNAKLLLTVSPVALAATATDQHVIVANTYSKAVLRAAVGRLAGECGEVEYFPAFELITQTAQQSIFYADDHREVSDEGVKAVMELFTVSHELGQQTPLRSPSASESPATTIGDVICEDALLDAFAP